jgi:hypothetical protein
MISKYKNLLLTPFNILYRISPEFTLKILFRLKVKRKLDLSNPKTYNEKIQWIKLYDRNPLMTVCSDKYHVRNYVAKLGLEHLLSNLLWEGFDPSKIPFDDLPDRFVIKITKGSGLNILCYDKSKIDKEATTRKLKKYLKQKFYLCYGEWFYEVEKPRIIVEEFLSEDGINVPKDYKMFYFNSYKNNKGIAFTAIDTDRFTNHKRIIYDENWNRLNKHIVNFPEDSKNEVTKPEKYKLMVEYASILCKPFKHARADFYIINDQIYFGEITFTSDAGFGKIEPIDFNLEMGSWLNLSENGLQNQ